MPLRYRGQCISTPPPLGGLKHAYNGFEKNQTQRHQNSPATVGNHSAVRNCDRLDGGSYDDGKVNCDRTNNRRSIPGGTSPAHWAEVVAAKRIVRRRGVSDHPQGEPPHPAALQIITNPVKLNCSQPIAKEGDQEDHQMQSRYR